MKAQHKYLGLDVHKETIAICLAEGGREGEVRQCGVISNDLHALERTLAKLASDGSVLHLCYEAGPTGFVIYRRMMQLKIDCIVVSPNKIPVSKGPRIKTDRRDAEQMARLLRAGELSGIHVPAAEDEAMRDLCRSRSDAVGAVRRCKQQLKGFLLRNGYKYTGKANWSDAHLRYLRNLRLTLPHQQMLLEELLLCIQEAQARLARIEKLIKAEVKGWHLYPVVEALMCLRGFKLTAATVTVAELGDVRRFEHPRQLMAFLGLIPKEDTTGESRHLGHITKSGNVHARWILSEVSQHACLPPKVSADLTTRQSGQPEPYIKIGWKAQTRLYTRHKHLLNRGVMLGKIKIAVTRELSGFVWDVMRQAFDRLDNKKTV